MIILSIDDNILSIPFFYFLLGYICFWKFSVLTQQLGVVPDCIYSGSLKNRVTSKPNRVSKVSSHSHLYFKVNHSFCYGLKDINSSILQHYVENSSELCLSRRKKVSDVPTVT